MKGFCKPGLAKRIFLVIIVFIFTSLVLITTKLREASISDSEKKELSNIEVVTNSKETAPIVLQDVGDFTRDGYTDYISFRGDRIDFVSSGKSDNLCCGYTIETTETFYDLFRFQTSDGNGNHKGFYTVQKTTSFPKTNPMFFAIESIFDSGGSYKTAFGVYKVDKSGVKRVFKKAFYEIPGRVTEVEFFKEAASFVVTGDLGRIGRSFGEIIPWMDYYDWDRTRQEFVLSNNKYLEEFRELYKTYTNINERGCGSSKGFPSNTTKSQHLGISFEQLVKKFPGVDEFCYTDVPIEREKIEKFLSAKKIIERIIRGENLTTTF